MADIRDWSTTAASNTDLFPENMAPSAVNDGMRTVQAELAQINKDMGGTITTAGTATAYTLTLTTSPASLADGLFFSATAHTTNTGGATTLVVTPSGGSAFSSKKIKTFILGVEADPAPKAMVANGHYLFQYDSAADSGTGAYILLNPSSGNVITSGTLSASSALTFDLSSAPYSSFKAFRLHLFDVRPATADQIAMRVSTDGATFSSSAIYASALRLLNSSAGTANTTSTQVAALLCPGVSIHTATGYGLCGTVDIYRNTSLGVWFRVGTSAQDSVNVRYDTIGSVEARIASVTHVRLLSISGFTLSGQYAFEAIRGIA